jgi:hypothetical protein
MIPNIGVWEMSNKNLFPLSNHEASMVIRMIINGDTDDALKFMSTFYHIDPPKSVIGLPRNKCFKAYACYVPSKHTIYFRDAESFRNPYIVLHEFYHVIRSAVGKHKGTEKYADEFAKKFIQYALTL